MKWEIFENGKVMSLDITQTVAVGARDGLIGLGGRLPWRMPSDLAAFQRLTVGGAVLMGRETWDSIHGTLPRRDVFVLSRTRSRIDGATACSSLGVALRAIVVAGHSGVVVAGGRVVYRDTLWWTSRVAITMVLAPPSEPATDRPILWKGPMPERDDGPIGWRAPDGWRIVKAKLGCGGKNDAPHDRLVLARVDS